MAIKRTIALMLSLLLLLTLLPELATSAQAAPSVEGCSASPSGKHDWGGRPRDPWCDYAGGTVWYCNYCHKYVFEETTPALGHIWGPREYTGYADCEHYGVFHQTCARCGKQTTGNDKPLGHDWDGGVITKQPTETEEGEITYTCKRDPSHTKMEVIPATGEDNGPHPALTLSATEDKITESKSEADNYGGASCHIYLYTLETVTNTGDIPLQLSRYVWLNSDVSGESDSDDFAGSLQPDGAKSEKELSSLYYYSEEKDGPGSYESDHIIATPDDPKYRGYCDVSICYYGYDIDDTDRKGEILCKSNVVTLRAYVPNEFEEAKPELTIKWDYDEIFHTSDTGVITEITTEPGVLALNDGASAWYTVTNSGNVPLKVVYYYAHGDGWTGYINYPVLSSSASAQHPAFTPFLKQFLTPGTETEELYGTTTISFYCAGYDPDTYVSEEDPGKELCRTETITRTWKLGKGTGSPDGGGDCCALSLETVSDTEAKYILHTCSAHMETAEAAEKLSLAGDWAGAAELWREEIEELYGEMAEKADEATAEAFSEDREAFFEYADAVQALFGDKEAAELLRLRCAEMCCVMSTAPIRLPSSLLGVYEELDASESFDAGGREIGAFNGSNSEVAEHYAGLAADAMADTRALLDKYADGQTDGVFAQSAEYWKSALDEMVNSAYRAAVKGTKPLIATWNMALNMLCDADGELYTQLYFTDPAAAEEHIMDLYREAALLLAEPE